MDDHAAVAADIAGAAAFAYAHGQLSDDELEYLLDEGFLDESTLTEDDLDALDRRAHNANEDGPKDEEPGSGLEEGALDVAWALAAHEDGTATIEELAHAIFHDRRFPSQMALERERRRLRAPACVVYRPRVRSRPRGRAARQRRAARSSVRARAPDPAEPEPPRRRLLGTPGSRPTPQLRRSSISARPASHNAGVLR